jgi:AcrR family transcriptional regulator
MAGHDLETHARLLNAAAELFAERGFKDVTVREICADADANVAAVNYHFSGKLGLYRQVVSKAIDTMRGTTDAARAAGVGLPPAGKLRAYVTVFVRRAGTDGQDSWIHRLMAREIADPTPVLDRIADEVITPRIEYVSAVIAEITGLPLDDEIVRRCALSIQAQCHAAMPHPLAKRAIDLSTDAASLDRLADHIFTFSLAGIEEVRKAPCVARREEMRPVQHKVQKVHRAHRG